jgi:hypothetical protein
MTADAFEEDRHACLAARVNERASGPVDPDRFQPTAPKRPGRRWS